ncbi:hypothetical protein AB2M62_06695 [Sphingomonas sp. MMS12-HWE2-04]|uniref:hypothetical protein n=1 Tax=Sphingomonas sp. MMS12-HWE2-04 TaxID=3234199 RepID=UPI00384FFE08
MTSFFHGSALVDVDAEGNAAIPGFVAEALADQASELIVARHEIDDCLVGYGPARLAVLAERSERRRLADEERGAEVRSHYHRMRRTFGMADRLPRSAATIRISAAMRHLGKIDGLALFVGTGDSFEIWNPELAMASEDPQFRDLAAFQLSSHNNTSLGVH